MTARARRSRLDKPLTARLMHPCPARKRAMPIEFDCSTLLPGRVMALEAQPLGRLFRTPGEITAVRPRLQP